MESNFDGNRYAYGLGWADGIAQVQNVRVIRADASLMAADDAYALGYQDAWIRPVRPPAACARCGRLTRTPAWSLYPPTGEHESVCESGKGCAA